jgi:hypothetical protein
MRSSTDTDSRSFRVGRTLSHLLTVPPSLFLIVGAVID